ncbi:TraB/GumN family protein [Herbaspirillum sp. YR522]|uniref:TraB/GumN family protein n=1 Tax=Herbaspirillum sp. YR522 TaxID=1144342 RepID=UPI00026FCD64|nr:TraB/GumN family protein [Herbaspirillum sp. YR522]EJN05476.1 hypothetical protein PMI40_02436 [Herbaspirillum sp. YR522]
MKQLAGRLIIVTLACLSWLYVPAARAAPAPSSAHAAAPARGALWRISDGTRSLYLFGTIHVGQPDFYPLEPRIMEALQAAPALALELDPARQGVMQQAVQRYGLLPGGQRFTDVLPPALAQRTQAALRQAGLPQAPLQHLRPWMLAITLTVQAFEAAGFQTALAVDNHLADVMRRRGRPVLELESAEQQLGLLGALGTSDEQQFLADTVDDLEDAQGNRRLSALVDAWRHADHAALQRALEELHQEDSFANRFALEVLLEGRNPGLADRIAALLMQYDKAVAAVGILHLVGPRGIPALLRQKGLVVEQLY